MTQETIRCFVAIELPEGLKAELRTVQAKFKAARMGFVKWVEPQGIHLTLKFIGWVPGERVPVMVKAIQEAVQGISPFTLELGSPGIFPDLRRPRVLWVGLRGDVDKLKTLQQNIDVSFGTLGFSEEEREFAGHLTLARLRDSALPDERKAFGELVTRTPFDLKSKFTVTSVNLMRSELKPAGAVYTPLAVVPLRAPQENSV